MQQRDAIPATLSVREARTELCRLVRQFREHPDAADPVFIGPNRHPDAVLVSAETFMEMAKWAERGKNASIEALLESDGSDGR